MSYNSKIANGVETNPVACAGACSACDGSSVGSGSCSCSTCDSSCKGSCDGCDGGCAGTCSSCAYNCSGMGGNTKIAPEVKF